MPYRNDIWHTRACYDSNAEPAHCENCDACVACSECTCCPDAQDGSDGQHDRCEDCEQCVRCAECTCAPDTAEEDDDEVEDDEPIRLELGMPAEHCRQCYYEQRQAGTSDTYRRHGGTGCRFGLCSEHCTCPAEQQSAWREITRTQSQLRCTNCGNGSAHCHTQYIQVQVGDGEFVTQPLGGSRCAACCQTCRNDEGTTRRRLGSTPPDCAQAAAHNWGWDLVQCERCHRNQPITSYIYGGRRNEYCVSCSIALRTMVRCRCGATPDATIGLTLCEDCNRCQQPEHHEASAERGQCMCSGCCTQNAVPALTRCCVCARVARPRVFQTDVRFTHTICPKPSKYNPVLRAIGVEIEVAGFNNPSKQALADVFNTCVKWNASIGTDGSIGTPNGVEIRLAPAAGKKFIAQLNDVANALRASKAIVNKNCGLHVHVDLRDVYDLYSKGENSNPTLRAMYDRSKGMLDRLVQVYWLMEPALYRMVDANRLTWRYCKAYRSLVEQRAREADLTATACLNGNTLPTYDLFYRTWGFDRYAGFNLHAFATHQTAEFRLHHGTVSRRAIVAWATLCASMVEWAVKATPEKIGKLHKYVQKNGEAGRTLWLQKCAPIDYAKRYVTWRSDRDMRRAA